MKNMDKHNYANPGNIEMLTDLVTMRMPFGRYKNRVLCDVPENYLLWFSRSGYPPGRLGKLLAALYEIKLNGLEYLLKPPRKN